MYQELELWKAEQAKKNKQIRVVEYKGTTTKETKVDKDKLLSAALAECFAMGV